MTRAPANLLAVRSLLLTHLNTDSDDSRPDDLEPAEVGVVGNAAHRGGYHCGSDRVVTGDYSVVESSRDRSGLTLDAAALDVGSFAVRVHGQLHNLRSFSTWCVAQCAADAPDSRDIREIIYSPDGRTVRRWDRLRRRSSGDDSHLWHTHFSFFRDAIRAGRPQTPLFVRYLTEIGLLEDEMTPTQFLAILRDPNVAALMRALPWQYAGGGIPAGMSTLGVLNEIVLTGRSVNTRVGGDLVDEPAIVAGILGGLDPARLGAAIQAAGITPAAIAAAVPEAIAQDVVDELHARMAPAQGQERE